jgi:DNA-binding GntR family transcriptional regulator
MRHKDDDHIVELRPNRGAIVAMPTPEEASKIFEARRALETAVLSLAVPKATKADIARLRRQLKEEREAMHTYAQSEWARLATAFHLRVAELSHNPVLAHYLAELLSRSSLIVALYEPAGNASCEHDEHARIVEFIEKGDADGAIRAMEEHLSVLEQRIHLAGEKPGSSLAHMLGIA